MEITETLVRSGAVDIVIVDSVAALVPKAEIDGEMGDSHMWSSGKTDVTGTQKTYGNHQQDQTVLLSLLTSCVRKLVLCLEIRRQQPADVH